MQFNGDQVADDLCSDDASLADGGLRQWAASGAMALTGRAGQAPLGPPAPLVETLCHLGRRLAARAAHLGATLAVDPLRVLGERAACMGWTRRGEVSVGGATRLLRAADGWLAVCLARPEDAEAVEAWLEAPAPRGDEAEELWHFVGSSVQRRPVGEVVERARLLGMPCAALPPTCPPPSPPPAVSVTAVPGRTRRPLESGGLGPVLVVDLSALWAGPLCSRLLRRAGAQVVKVESVGRPDGARRTPAFFDVLHAGKQSVALDFGRPADVEQLRQLLARADVVVESSRPRALEQLGIKARDLLAVGPSVWLSITGYGRRLPAGNRVAFGDDAAVAGGLVVRDAEGPCFCADAIADPLTGLVAADAVLAALGGDRRVLLDVAMAGVASRFAGPTVPVTGDVRPVPPTAPQPDGRAPALGADNETVLGRQGSRQ